MKLLAVIACCAIGCSSKGGADRSADHAATPPRVIAADAPAPPIRFTAAAAAKVAEIARAEGIAAGVPLRARVVRRGDAFEYDLFFDDATAVDVVFETSAIKVVVDPDSLQQLRGTEIDFLETARGAGFKFNNPNVREGGATPATQTR